MRRFASLTAILMGGVVPAAAPAQEFGVEDPAVSRLPPVWEETADEPLADEPLFEPPESPSFPDLPRESPPSRDRVGGPPGRGAPFTARLYWLPQQDVTNQPGTFALSGEQIELKAPVAFVEDGIWLALGGVERLEIASDVILPDSGLTIPDTLWKVSLGTMHIRDLGDGWSAGGMLSVGASSDQPFAGSRDMTATVLAFLSLPHGERDAWNFSVFYSPTSQIPFPIPGVAYIWRPNDQFHANIGIPFAIDYRPTESFTLTASYMPLTNVRLRGAQSLAAGWSLYAGYEVVNETFWLSDRTNEQDRLYLFDQRLLVGLKRDLGYGFSVDVSAGYVFDRRLFQAEGFSDHRHDLVEIESGVGGMLQLQWTR